MDEFLENNNFKLLYTNEEETVYINPDKINIKKWGNKYEFSYLSDDKIIYKSMIFEDNKHQYHFNEFNFKLQTGGLI